MRLRASLHEYLRLTALLVCVDPLITRARFLFPLLFSCPTYPRMHAYACMPASLPPCLSVCGAKADHVLKQIATIRERRKAENPFFDDHVHSFASMLQKFQL